MTSSVVEAPSPAPSPRPGGASTSRRPLAFARESVIEQAQRLGIERPVENVVEERIAAGFICRGRKAGFAVVNLGEGIFARVVESRSASGRKAWTITSVADAGHTKRAFEVFA